MFKQGRFMPYVLALLVFVVVELLFTPNGFALAATLCVNPGGTSHCYASITAAVAAAAPRDIIKVAPGTYKEDVIIGKPLSLLGANHGNTFIDATGLANGIYVDGFDNRHVSDVVGPASL